jgi:ABC-type dipeptide/oligopeptide/nickel transport system permease subunit
MKYESLVSGVREIGEFMFSLFLYGGEHLLMLLFWAVVIAVAFAFIINFLIGKGGQGKFK